MYSYCPPIHYIVLYKVITWKACCDFAFKTIIAKLK